MLYFLELLIIGIVLLGYYYLFPSKNMLVSMLVIYAIEFFSMIFLATSVFVGINYQDPVVKEYLTGNLIFGMALIGYDIYSKINNKETRGAFLYYFVYLLIIGMFFGMAVPFFGFFLFEIVRMVFGYKIYGEPIVGKNVFAED